MTEKRKPYKKGLKADYKGASPEQVTRVVLSYKRPVRHDSLKVMPNGPKIKSSL